MSRLTNLKQFSFYCILFIISIFIFISIEFTLRCLNLGVDLSLFQKSAQYQGYYEINMNVGKRYFTKFEPTIPLNDIFLIKKPDTAYRIFVLGSSTAAGFPFQSGNAFSRILYYRLQDVFPEKRIEVVNLALTAVNSYAFSDMIDEVMDYQPDAILIYGGQNEYYGCLGPGSADNRSNSYFLKKAHLKLIKLRTYQFVQDLLYKFVLEKKNNVEFTTTLMHAMVKEKSIPKESKLYFSGLEQFEKNISHVLKKAKRKHIPVIISELISNIKDQKPFGSLNNPENSAEELFKRAQEYEKSGNYDLAKSFYYNAKDHDIIRFRAPEDINNIIHVHSKKYNANVVPMKTIFEQHSPHGLIGNNLILEHVHPNIDGYFLMADAFFNTMRKYQLISKDWNKSRIKSSEFYRHNWGFTSLDSLSAEISIKCLKNGWPFKPKNEANLFDQQYVPINFVDSLTFKYKDYSMEQQHIVLASYYISKGDENKAFKEYYSLIKCYPYIFDLYVTAANFLIDMKKYDEAIELINSAPNKKDPLYHETLKKIQMQRNMQ